MEDAEPFHSGLQGEKSGAAIGGMPPAAGDPVLFIRILCVVNQKVCIPAEFQVIFPAQASRMGIVKLIVRKQDESFPALDKLIAVSAVRMAQRNRDEIYEADRSHLRAFVAEPESGFHQVKLYREKRRVHLVREIIFERSLGLRSAVDIDFETLEISRAEKREPCQVVPMRVREYHIQLADGLILDQLLAQEPDTGTGIDNYLPAFTGNNLKTRTIAAVAQSALSRSGNRAPTTPDYDIHFELPESVD